MANTKTMAHEPIFFWKESDSSVGWLCQWYYHPFRDDEVPERLYYTAEHYMMYQKAKHFGDGATAAEILRTKPPRKAKALGRKVANFDEAVWEAKREAVVLKGNKLKFGAGAPAPGQTPTQPGSEGSLCDKLLRTGDTELVEASPFDRVWGVGFRPEEAEANRGRWGLNLLGKALMEVRAALREEGEKRRHEHKITAFRRHAVPASPVQVLDVAEFPWLADVVCDVGSSHGHPAFPILFPPGPGRRRRMGGRGQDIMVGE